MPEVKKYKVISPFLGLKRVLTFEDVEVVESDIIIGQLESRVKGGYLKELTIEKEVPKKRSEQGKKGKK